MNDTNWDLNSLHRRLAQLALETDTKLKDLCTAYNQDFDLTKETFENILEGDYDAPKYVICKRSRDEPYRGNTWRVAGIKHLCRPYYTNPAVARDLAAKLTIHNPVGFEVIKIE